MDNKIICIVGPTASGKTKIAIDLAKEISGEIICADSMQVYKKMNIATAKPTLDEISQVPHHLFDFVSPSNEFSVAEYVKCAQEKIFDIKSRGKIPVIVGGTGLYIDSLVRGNEFAKRENSDIRKKYEDIALEKGNVYLHNLLKDIDFESYEKLFPNDTKRVVRALEVKEITGKTISEHNRQTKLTPDKFNATYFGVNFTNRQDLYDRINLRVDLMIEAGLLFEAKEILSDKSMNKTAFSAIGYKELIPYFENNVSLCECIDKIKQESRRYAKRQITWFKRNQKIHWFEHTDIDLIKEATKIVKRDFYG